MVMAPATSSTAMPVLSWVEAMIVRIPVPVPAAVPAATPATAMAVADEASAAGAACTAWTVRTPANDAEGTASPRETKMERSRSSAR